MKIFLAIAFMLFNTSAEKIKLDKPVYFIAMEYKGLSNCIYKVYVTDSLLMAAKVNGYITVAPNLGIGTTISKLVMHDPEAYVNKKMDARYDSILFDKKKFLQADNQNFIIRRENIKKVYHDPTPKWGMGYYPHNGKIIIESIKTKENRKSERELILIGDQNSDEILRLFR